MKQNGIMMQYFHWYYGNTNHTLDLWDKVKQESSDLSAHGVTGLWLPPAYKGSHGKNDVGYSIYDLYDLGEFDQKGSIRTKYGTKQQYIEAINEAHANQIQVYGDVVFNHKAGADETEWVKAVRVHENDHRYTYGEDAWVEAWTKFYFPARKSKYSDFVWRYYHFDGVDWAHNLKENTIFKFLGLGKGWDDQVDLSHGNYDYLMHSDLDMDHPEVRTELAKWAKWFIQFTDVDGFRIDAVKHIKFSFFRDWLRYLRGEFPDKDLFAVGEYWSDSVDDLTYYVEKTDQMMSLFDAPLQKKLYDASRAGLGNYDMRYILDNTLVQRNPLKAVTLVDNHDTQPGQSLERWVDYWFKPLAYALILLREGGYPCVFYPDYYGASYSNNGHSIDLQPVKGLKEMMKARKIYAYGKQRDYFDHHDIIGWIREGEDQFPRSGMAVLLSDGPGGSKWMEVGKRHSGQIFYDLLDNHSAVITINDEGWANFNVEGGSVSVWVPKGSEW